MWGFKGMVVTDYTAIAEMMDHGLGDLKTVSALALNAGTDMDMMSDGYRGTLAQSIAEGKVSEAAVNAACRRVLEAKWKLGLFADPYRYCNEKRAKKEIFTPDNLMFYNQQLEYKCEPGDFNIMVGPNSRDVQTLKFSLK